jgi:asparagine synthase (glutamine-hydrolysing)
LNICNQAKKDGFKVLLGGTGGDDVFSGYRRHQALRYEVYINSIPLFLREFTKWIFLKFNLNNSWIRRVKKVTSNLHETKINRVYGYFEWLPLNIVKGLFHSDLKGVVEKYNPRRFFIDLLSNISSTENDLNKSLFWELKTFLVDHNLNYTDKLGMATGVEIRVPFLDKELVEFSTTIPPSLKMKGSSTKYILKKLMERYLPYEVIYRSKAGFGAPVRDWVIHNLDEKIETYLGEKSIKKRGIFDAAKIQELIELNKKGKIDASYSIWGLLAIESWMRTFLDDNTRI